MTTATEPKAELMAPAGVFVELKPWAKANSLGQNAVYEFCRRTIDPIPHIKIGRKYLIENEAALTWLRRKFGSGYGRKVLR